MRRAYTDFKLADCISDPGKRRQYNERLFTLVAPKYDLATRLLSFGQDARWKRILIENIPNLQAPQCLDIACGTGDISFALARKFPNGHVIGIDLTAAMIEAARRRSLLPNLEYEIQDMCSIERIPSQSIDIVTGGYALRNAQDLNQMLCELRRVMKPGATAAFLEFSKPLNRHLQRFHRLVLETWSSCCGLLLHGNADVYRYIPRSLHHFPNRQELRTAMGMVGLHQIKSRSFLTGMVEITIWRKTV